MGTTEIFLALAVIVLAGALGFIIYLFLQQKKSGVSDQSIQLLQSQMLQLSNLQNDKFDRTLSELNQRLFDQLHKSQFSMQQQFTESQRALRESGNMTQKIVKDVTEKLTKLDETNKQVIGFAEQLQSLENILKNPKQRGVLGEYFLETVLKNVLPPDAFQLQYKFKNGEAVDAVIFTKDKLIPIDAKFSLENYNRLASAETKEERGRLEKLFKQDLVNRIDETSKYIRPEENSYEFAFMFIPADGLYYDLLSQRVGTLEINSKGLIEYAFSKKVIIVSPTTLFAYLQTVLQGLRALKIEESAKEILTNVTKLQKHIGAYEEHMVRLGGHLQKASGSYDTAVGEFRKVNKDVLRITGMTEEAVEVAEDDGLTLLSDKIIAP